MFKMFDIKDRLYEKGVYRITYELSDSSTKLETLIENNENFTLDNLTAFLKKVIPNLDTTADRINLKKTEFESVAKRSF